MGVRCAWGSHWLRGGFGSPRILDSSSLALIDTVHTSYAAAIVDGVFPAVDARSLAVAFAEPTAVALVGVDDRLEP